MSQYLLTGGNGFLGKYLVDKLLEGGHQLALLIRNPQSARNLELLDRWENIIKQNDNGSSLELWCGDVSKPELGLKASQTLSGFDSIYHLAAIYDLNADSETVINTNVGGTKALLEKMAEDKFSGTLHFVSSIAVAGDYQGEFSEAMFDEGQKQPHNYHLSKYQSEALIREWRDKQADFDIRIYRPSAIVGHSKTGEIDKIDGPYYMFMLVAAIKKWLPPWMPLVAPKLRGTLDMVPVDYVADALFTISQLKADQIPDGQFCFHLTDPKSPDMLRTFKHLLRSADGPKIRFSIPIGRGKSSEKKDQKKTSGIAATLSMATQLKGAQLIQSEMLKSLGIPDSVFKAMMPGVVFSAEITLALLAKENIRPPVFKTYVDALWDYYNRHLDPAKNRELLSSKAFAGKTILITGGSSGIGLASAERALGLGANVILVARDEQKLSSCVEQLSPLAKNQKVILDSISCDLSDPKACDDLITQVLSKYGHVDILFNNAGRSIRRSISKSHDRLHDLERTMQLNYFGAARLMIGLLPSMVANGGGHILHSSTMGTMAPTPRFGAYLASKCALDALMDATAAEYANRNIALTSIKYPLVKTAMIAPTSDYEDAPAASPEFAAQMFVDAVIDRPRKQISGTGVILGAVSLLVPNLITQAYNYAYQIWPDEKGDFPEMAMDRSLMTSIVPNAPI